MSTYEEELLNLESVIRRLVSFSLFGKKVVLVGEENFIKEGPNIIVGNHLGSYKDVAVLFEIIPRPIFFTANKMIFNKADFNYLIRKHLKRHLKEFGLFLDLLLKPMKRPFVDFISTNITKIGTIPVDLYGRKTLALEKCQEYLKKSKAVILLQGRGRVMKHNPNPYIAPFRKGPSIIAYNLYNQDRIAVPVTPIAMFGTHKPWVVPGNIKVKVGKPLFVSDYLAGGIDNTVDLFRDALEKKVHRLFYDLIKS